jgi:flagella basal body P-ring formation protein FlgA
MRLVLASAVLLSIPLSVGAIPVQRIPAERLVAVARAEIDARIGEEKSAAQVTLIGAPEDVTVQAGQVDVRAHAIAGRWPRSRIGVPVDVVVAGHTVRSATVWFSLGLQRQVLSYAGSYPADTDASTLSFASTDADVASLQGDVVVDAEALKGLQLRRAIPAGNVVQSQDFERIPDVKRGDHIDVLVQHGAVHMSARGVAIDPGLQGQTVHVLVDGAESQVQAQITAKGVVQVVQ